MSKFEIPLSLLEKAAKTFHLEDENQTAEEKRKIKNELTFDSQKLISDFFDGWKEKGNPILRIAQGIDELNSAADSSWYPTIKKLKELLLKQANEEAKKRSPWHKIKKYFWLIILGIIFLFALLVRHYSAVDVTDQITLKTGLIERAAAFKKILRYEDLMLEKGERKGGPLKTFLYWPISPTKDEVTYAEEFIGGTKEVYKILLSQSAICDVPAEYTADPMSAPKEILKFIQKQDFASKTSQIEDSIKLIEMPFVEKFPCSK